jgi:hypothetical protein
MKAILKFNLPEEQEEFTAAIEGANYIACLRDISNQVFRPARKHGYTDGRIEAILRDNEIGYELIELLEEKFTDILAENYVHLY